MANGEAIKKALEDPDKIEKIIEDSSADNIKKVIGVEKISDSEAKGLSNVFSEASRLSDEALANVPGAGKLKKTLIFTTITAVAAAGGYAADQKWYEGKATKAVTDAVKSAGEFVGNLFGGGERE